MKKKENKHEHWAKKSAIVAIIASVITFLGGLDLLIYTSGHIMPFPTSLLAFPFWIAVITLFVIAVLVDYVKNNLKKVYWIEDIIGGIFGAVGYYSVFAIFGVVTFTTPSGFVVGAVILFVLFYIGFIVGHWIDKLLLKPAGIEIN